jgi:hypothetical protein
MDWASASSDGEGGRKRTSRGPPHRVMTVTGTAAQFRLPCGRYTSSGKRVSRQLLAETEFLHDGLVTVGIVSLEIVQQATPLADQHEKTTARTVILQVRLEVFRQLTNALA